MIFPDRFVTPAFEYVNYTLMDEVQSRAIWQARNHPDIRKFMTCTEPFTFESHTAFIGSLKTRNDRVYYAVLKGGAVVGSMCLNPYDPVTKTGEMGKYLVPEYMGRGIGFSMAKEFLDYMFEYGIVEKVVARTLATNMRNRHVNAKLGFRECGEDATYVYMEKLK